MQCAPIPFNSVPPPQPCRRSTPIENIQGVLWAAIRHLFPAHAKALPTSSAGFAISWSMDGDPHAKYTHAAPILIKLEDDLVDALAMANHEQRKNIARRQELVVRAGMTGYDPYAAVPKTRAIVLG